MGNAVIPRRKGGNYATVEFENYEFKTLEKREVENLGKARNYLAAASVDDYALFAGGNTLEHFYANKVDAYNTSLVHSLPAALSERRHEAGAAKVGEYCLFAGGGDLTSAAYSNVDAYSNNLVHTTPASLSVAREPAGASVGNYALFAGGYGDSSELSTSVSTDIVDVYDTNLAQSTATSLTVARGRSGSATVGNYAIFLTTQKPTGPKVYADAYDENLVHTNPTNPPNINDCAGTTSIVDYALFGYAYSKTVVVYNSQLIQLTPVALSNEKNFFAATTVGNFALFGGGYYSQGNNFDNVEGFDQNLVLHQFEDLSEARGTLAATTVGNYALFGGGHTSTYSATVDCYEYVEKDLELTLYKGTRYKFQGMDAEAMVEADIETKTIATPATGYIKLKKVTLS